MQPRPGRHRADAAAEIVAAAIVQVPQQLRVAEALSRQPRFESHSVLRKLDGREARFLHWNRIARRPLRRAHRLGKAAVLRQRGRAHALHGQQAVLPLAVEEQALLRAVAQVALVVHPAPGHTAAQAQFFQKILHRPRIVARHRQVVRAQRAGDAQHRAASAVAAGVVFQFQQREVVMPIQAQRPRR